MDFEKRGALLVPVDEPPAKGFGKYRGAIIRGGYYDDDGVWHRGKQIVDMFEDANLVVDQGLTYMLGAALYGTSQHTNWYAGVFSGNYTPVASVTAAGIALAATEATVYDGTTRPQWVPAAPTPAPVTGYPMITNAANRADFVFNDDATIYGAFIISDNTKSGTTGTLFSAARFNSEKVVSALDELLLTYSFTLSAA